MATPSVQYVTTSDGVDIAYRVTGEGYPVVAIQGPPFTHIQREQELASFLRYAVAIERGRQVVHYDGRGSGMSQRGIPEFTIEGLASDLVAVVDRLELDRFAIYAAQSGGLIAASVAASMPERVSNIFFMDGYVNGARYAEIPQVSAFLGLAASDWAMFTETVAHSFFGWDAGPAARAYAQYLRDCVNQDECIRFFTDLLKIDLTHLLPGLTMPSLVFHHTRSLLPDMDMSRQLASRLPNAEFILLNGFWNDPQDDVVRLDSALTQALGTEQAAGPSFGPSAVGSLVTILFTDIEGSTALTQRLGDVAARDVFREHERLTREALARHGGSEVKTMGDGFMASFGSANAALACAVDMQRAFAAHNAVNNAPLNVRIGVNAGEPIAEKEDLFGTAVITAARIAAQAKGGEILVSNVVRELIAGRGFLFSDRGEIALRGFDDPVRVYEMKWKEEA